MTLIFFHWVLNYIHCRVKCVLVSLFFSQTQGPSGHIYASSNPEYLSANDGEKKKKDSTICSVCIHQQIHFR